MEDSLLRIEKTLAQLRQTLSRLRAHLPSSSSSSSSEAAAGDNFRQRLPRPFILHRNQWRRLLDSYQQLFRHIGDVLLTILLAPLQSLLFAMESAERSLEECIAPHIYESVYDVNNRSPHIIASFHENTSDPDRRPALDSDGDGDDGRMTADDVNLTKEQLADLELWMMKKALKHGLSGEVEHLHMENIRTCAIAVFESLTNYSASSDDLGMAFEPQTWQTADVETTTTQLQHRSRARNVEDLDLDLAQRFFGQQLKRSIMHSPCTLAIAQLVGDRISLCSKVEHSHRAPNTTATAIAKSMIERLKVAPAQFSYIMHKGEKVKVGEGGQSSVFLKTWMLESHRVAVKEVVLCTDASSSHHTDASSTHQHLKDFKEAATQARLYHPNLLPLLCFTHEERNDYICLRHLHASIARSGDMDLEGAFSSGNKKHIFGLAMELMLCDLGEVINSRKAIIRKRGTHEVVPFPLHVSVDIMLQLAKAMEHLHHHGIMHRDLKPANILISLDSAGSLEDDNRLFFRVKIADFGCSKALASTYSSSSSSAPEEHTSNVGTGFYRAPEVMKLHQTSDPTTYSKRVDVYSFALVCYQVMTGRVPFQRDASPFLPNKIQKENHMPAFYEHESVCPAALVDMIQCCWHADPSQRPNFAQIASFLSYVKACAVPLLGSGGEYSEVDNWKKALVQIFHREKLFSTFRSNDRRGSNRMIEMCMEMRRMIMVERGYSWVAGSGGTEKKPVSLEDNSSASSQAQVEAQAKTQDEKERGFSLAAGVEKIPLSHGWQAEFLMDTATKIFNLTKKHT